MDVIARIRNDRAEARKLSDSNADICFLALADQAGRASIRTLVLRDISDNRFLLFLNQSSPKWNVLTAGGSYQLLLWYPSMQRQYRIAGTTSPLSIEVVKRNWQRRPTGSKLLDLLYERKRDQSSPIDSREALVDDIREIRQSVKVDSIEAPEKVAGIELVAETIEMLDLNREDRIYDRRLFTLTGSGWSTQYLVP